MKRFLFGSLVLLFVLYAFLPATGSQVKKENSCMECHEIVTPGIVNDFKNSKHYLRASISCTDCHCKREGPDTFFHEGHRVNLVVTPRDCGRCHKKEEKEYELNMMSHAYGNLILNPIYLDLAKNVNLLSETGLTMEDSCLSCHGTKIEVKGKEKRETPLGQIEFPKIEGWPNTGVGRINPDGSQGSCSACHPRHSFSVSVARRPDSCSRCHKGPDVPAYKIYSVSKHGIIYASHGKKWNFEAKPWILGKDYNAPTCATCHISEVRTDTELIAERTHSVSTRLPRKLFGIPYATNHPKSPKTYEVRNRMGLPLLSELSGEPRSEYLIDEKEYKDREAKMRSICLSCHSSSFAEKHFLRLNESVRTSNEITRRATQLLLSSYKEGIAKMDDGLFNETIEKMWVETWLFYSNSIRLSSAMGGADYGVFDGGRWNLGLTLERMKEYRDLLFLLTQKKKTVK